MAHRNTIILHSTEAHKLSRQMKITLGKSKSLTPKANSLNAIFLPSGIHQFSLAFVYFYSQFYILQNNFWLRHVLVNVQYNIDRDQKKAVSTIFIHNLEMKSPRSCVRLCACSFLHLAVTREARAKVGTLLDDTMRGVLSKVHNRRLSISRAVCCHNNDIIHRKVWSTFFTVMIFL